MHVSIYSKANIDEEKLKCIAVFNSPKGNEYYLWDAIKSVCKANASSGLVIQINITEIEG